MSSEMFSSITLYNDLMISKGLSLCSPLGLAKGFREPRNSDGSVTWE